MKSKLLYLTFLVYVILLALEIIYIEEDKTYKEKTNKIIEKVFIKKEIISKKNESYEGYLEYNNIKRLIVGGDNESVLDNNLVWIYKHDNFQALTGNIVLAGHNNKYVFNFITKASIGDIIKIHTKNNYKNYKIYNKIVVDEDSNLSSYLDNSNKLLLITCVNNNTKRLIIFAK